MKKEFSDKAPIKPPVDTLPRVCTVCDAHQIEYNRQPFVMNAEGDVGYKQIASYACGTMLATEEQGFQINPEIEVVKGCTKAHKVASELRREHSLLQTRFNSVMNILKQIAPDRFVSLKQAAEEFEAAAEKEQKEEGGTECPSV